MSRLKVYYRILFFKLLSFFLSVFFVSLLGNPVNAAQVIVEWDPNTETDLKGYNLYYGTATRTYGSPVNVGNKTSYTVTGLDEGQTYYFAVTSYDIDNNESGYSKEVSLTTPIRSSPANQPPVANNGSLIASEGIESSSTLIANDTDGDALIYAILNNGSKGTARITNPSTGSYIYTPDINASGTDTFTFIVNDGSIDSNVATVTITISESGSSTKYLVWDQNSETDIDGYKVHYGIASRVYDSQIDVGNQTRYSLGGFNDGRTYYFAVKAYNKSKIESDYSEEISWTSPSAPPSSTNKPPVANNGNLIISEDTEVGSTLSASDPDGDLLTYTIVNNGSNGTITLLNASTGKYTYRPNANATGTDTLAFKVNDGKADSNVATITVNITNVNDPPTIKGRPVTSVAAGAAYRFLPIANDLVAGDTLMFSITSKPAWAFFNSTTGLLSGTPKLSDVGTTNGIVISVTDRSGASASLSAYNLTVTSSNNPPIANHDNLTTLENTEISGFLSANDGDGDSLTYIIESNGSKGTIMLTNASVGAYSYKPNINATGTDAFTFKVNDGIVDSNVATVTITIMKEEVNTKIFGSAFNADFPGTIEDTWVNINNTSYDDAELLSTWSWSTSEPHKVCNNIIMKVNLSAIPQSAVITDARFYLYQNTTYGNPTYINTVHEILNKNLVISEATGYNASATEEWSSVPAGTTYKNIPLGLADIAAAEDTVVLDTNDGYVSWSVRRMVQDWISDPSSNHGFLIKGEDGTSKETGREYASSEHADPSIRPKLVISYMIGTPQGNKAPQAYDNNITTIENTPVDATLTASDVNGDSLVYYLVNNGSKGVATIINEVTGAYTYTPNANATGIDGFTFKVNDGKVDSNVAMITVTITNQVLPGDIDNNGTIDLVDLRLVQKLLAGTTPEVAIYREADVDGDGKIGSIEMSFILKKLSTF